MEQTGDRFRECWDYFNPPRKLSNATFENYIPGSQQQQAAKEKCQEYTIDHIKTGRGLLLAGSYGLGKSHLAVATVRALMESDPEQFGKKFSPIGYAASYYNMNRTDFNGIYCSFFSIVELLEYWRPGSETKQKYGEWYFSRAKTDDLVILDDLGTEKATDWTGEKLYAVIDSRYRMERATIITTNYGEKELAANGYGAIVSRLYEMTEQVKFIGQDYRRKRA